MPPAHGHETDTHGPTYRRASPHGVLPHTGEASHTRRHESALLDTAPLRSSLRFPQQATWPRAQAELDVSAIAQSPGTQSTVAGSTRRLAATVLGKEVHHDAERTVAPVDFLAWVSPGAHAGLSASRARPPAASAPRSSRSAATTGVRAHSPVFSRTAPVSAHAPPSESLRRTAAAAVERGAHSPSAEHAFDVSAAGAWADAALRALNLSSL